MEVEAPSCGGAHPNGDREKSFVVMRRIIKSLLLVFVGIFVGVVAYEAIMFIRVSRLRSANPATTSLIEARQSEAEARG